jgi:hypothetical protein
LLPEASLHVNKEISPIFIAQIYRGAKKIIDPSSSSPKTLHDGSEAPLKPNRNEKREQHVKIMSDS